MRDYEGLSGPLHRYNIETVRTMLKLCEDVGAERLLICSSTSPHASGKIDDIAADLRKVAMLAAPLGLRVGFEALSRMIGMIASRAIAATGALRFSMMITCRYQMRL